MSPEHVITFAKFEGCRVSDLNAEQLGWTARQRDCPVADRDAISRELIRRRASKRAKARRNVVKAWPEPSRFYIAA